MRVQNPDDLIARIREVQEELSKLGIRREYINFRRLRTEELAECLESIDEQLKTRKRFLGQEVNMEL